MTSNDCQPIKYGNLTYEPDFNRNRYITNLENGKANILYIKTDRDGVNQGCQSIWQMSKSGYANLYCDTKEVTLDLYDAGICQLGHKWDNDRPKLRVRFQVGAMLRKTNPKLYDKVMAEVYQHVDEYGDVDFKW